MIYFDETKICHIKQGLYSNTFPFFKSTKLRSNELYTNKSTLRINMKYPIKVVVIPHGFISSEKRHV